ncbi:MAG: alpha/beta fold hydrolase, partial [Nanoarchaeota archaeon]|nr:alpha/beta fold hydrolase [Nanoarchaeota archaeon]
AETTANGNCGDGKDNDCDGYTDSADSGCSSCSGTDTSCGTYPSCTNCNSDDGCSGNYYYNYYCVSNAAGCSHISDSCTDCSCSCGGYNTAETTANGNCGDGKDNDCDGYTDSSDSGCSSCSGTDTSCGVYPTCNNCNADDGCYGNFYRDYYCSGTSCSYNLNNCAADCSCSCGGYNTEETIANGNCDDGKDNDCDGYTDHGDSGCYSCDNMVKDGDETDIDCGGSCNPCEDWKSCIISSDCYSNLCDQSACKTPVLLIHGYLSKPATFNTLNSRLANDGFVVYNDFDYERITNNLANGNIKSYSHLLEGEINNIKSETGAVKVDIVANSMGGLIARWYSISHLDTIKNIVMLGTPNHGSHIANQAWILNLIGYYQTQYSKEEVDLILSGWSSIARTQLGVCSDFLKILNYGSDISYSLCESYDAFDHLNYYSNHNQDEIINERVTHSVIAAIINTRASNTWQWAVYRDYGDGIVNIHSAWLNKGSKTKVLNQNHGDLLEDSGTYGEIKNTLKNSNYHSSELVQSISEQSLSEELPQNLTGPENIQEFPELFGEIGNYETKTYSYNVSEVNLLEIIATLFSENMGVNIISPSGIAINKSSCNNDCNFSKENSVNIFDLLNPEDGTWQVEITYNNTGSHYYSLILLTQSNYSFYQVPTETSILPGDSVALKINFSQNNNHIAGSSVHVSINSSDYHYESALYDDGLHGDGLANDGIFTLNFTPPSLGDYYLEFIGSFERNGLTIKNAIYFTVTARTLVDLTANQLTFNSTYFFEGNNMTAIAEIENLAGYTAKNATIMLYSDDSLNNLLDNITIDFDPYEKKNVSFHWSNLTEGSYNLTVMISPFNEFMESNYSNNLLKKIIHIYTHGIILNEYSNLNLIFNSFGSKVVYIKIPQNKAISKAQFDVELKESQGTQSLTIKANEKSLTAINEYLDSNEDNTQKFSIPDYKDIPELNRELFDESNTDTIYYELNISDIQVNQNNNYSELNIDGFYYTQDNGKPILPIKYFEIPLPPEAETFNIEVVNPTYSEIDLGKKIKPFVLDYNLFRENSFKEDEVYGTYYSTPNLVTVNFGYKGEQKYALLKYYPFGYDSVKGKLNVTTHASLKLSYGNFQYLSNTVQSESIESTTESIPDVEWSKTFGGTGDDLADDVQQTNDGGYIISGYTGSGGFYGAYLIKTDPNGNIEWSKTFGGYDRAKSVQQTNDDGYIIAGYTDSFGAGNYDAYLIKIDPNGNIEWSKTFGGTGDDLADDVQQTNDGGYILSGVINYYNVWGGDSWLIKTDTNGNEQWNKTFGGSSKEEAYSVQQTNDSGYILGGDTYSFGNGDSDGYLVKTDSNGNMEWSKTFGINRPDRGYYDGFKSVQQTNDLGYILAGYTENTDGSDFYLVKTDINGNLEWNKTFSARLSWDEAKSVYQTNDDGYIVVGFAHSSISDNSDFFIVKTGPNGNYKWSKKFGGSGDDWANSAQQTSDGGYILAGYTDSFGAGNNDVYLVKLLSKSASIDILNDDNIEYAITLNQKITVNMSNLSNTYYNQDYDVLVPILISSNSAGIVEITNIDLEFKETKDYNYLLRRDWNLISSPIKSADNSIDYIFDLIDYSSILSFNNANNHWLFYKNESSNNFNTIDITKAYWLNSPLNQTLTIEGTEFTYPINFSLKEGWNLISYPSLNTTLINESLKEVNNTYASIMAYKDNNWLIYSPHKPTNLNTLTNLTPWQGYWIKVPRDINWTFDGTKFS